MNIYIAGRYSRRDEFRLIANTLMVRGIGVTSTWLDEDKPLDGHMGDESDAFYARTSKLDLHDIDQADAVLFFAEDPKVGTPRGGRHVEFGYALARGKFIDVVGPKENVFHYGNPMIRHWDTFANYIAANTREVLFS